MSRVCSLERMAAWEILFLAAAKARRGKSRRPDVEDWWRRREANLAALSEELLGGMWQPGPYRIFTIHELKRRQIAAAPFRDRVVHHALCNLLGPVLERRFIARSFSCQVGKGTTAARECCRQLVNRHRYVLKCDVRKFLPSIDHALLLSPCRSSFARMRGSTSPSRAHRHGKAPCLCSGTCIQGAPANFSAQPFKIISRVRKFPGQSHSTSSVFWVNRTKNFS